MEGGTESSSGIAQAFRRGVAPGIRPPVLTILVWLLPYLTSPPVVFRREQSFIFDKLKGAVARETARTVLSQSNLAFYARHFCGISISISDA